DHLQRDDLDLADQLLAHVQPLEEVRRQAYAVQLGHDELADAVVQDAFAVQHRPLLIVEVGRVVLEILDQGAGFRTLIEDLGFAFINLAALRHLSSPSRRPGRAASGSCGNRSSCSIPYSMAWGPSPCCILSAEEDASLSLNLYVIQGRISVLRRDAKRRAR